MVSISAGPPFDHSIAIKHPPSATYVRPSSTQSSGACTAREITTSAVATFSARGCPSARPSTARILSLISRVANACFKKATLRPDLSSTVTSRSGSASLIGIPGKPPPLPMSSKVVAPVTWGTTASESTKCFSKISAGPVIAVRLTFRFQRVSSSRNRCSLVAASCDSDTPTARAPSSSSCRDLALSTAPSRSQHLNCQIYCSERRLVASQHLIHKTGSEDGLRPLVTPASPASESAAKQYPRLRSPELSALPRLSTAT